jgi:hypothetical protein
MLGPQRGQIHVRTVPRADQQYKLLFPDKPLEAPHEIHLVRFESDGDLLRYSDDEERKRLLPLKEQSVRNSLLIKGTLA